MIKYKPMLTSNGIAVYDGNDVIQVFPDIPLPKRKIRKLCRTYTRLRLAPEHLKDVLEDTLYEYKNAPLAVRP